MLIYIIEDNTNVREAVAGYLRLEGFEVNEYEKLREVKRIFERQASPLPNLLILDVMLPDGDGFLFAKQLKELDIYKKAGNIPIIFLTARDQESDRITGLELGADDYMIKPFSAKELVLRVKAVLKRSMPKEDRKNLSEKSFFLLDNDELLISHIDHQVYLNKKPLQLTAAEWNILVFLSTNAPQVFTRLQLLDNCLDSIAEGSERTIDTHIKNIRHKLYGRKWIETVRSFGYRFRGSEK